MDPKMTDNKARDYGIVIQLLKDNQDFLMERLRDYALDRGYTKYTSTLKEAWRLSVVGLTEALERAVKIHSAVPELNPEEDYRADPLAEFGSIEAQRHRERGIDLAMFLGLFKYYRQSFQDTIAVAELPVDEKDAFHLFINRVFDRIEIGISSEWILVSDEEAMEELRYTNRFLVNEKNKYLTIFESIAKPAFFLDSNHSVDNINRAASVFLGRSDVPGAEYYCRLRDRNFEFKDQDTEVSSYTGCLQHESLGNVLPWLAKDLEEFSDYSDQSRIVEKTVSIGSKDKHFEVQFMKMLDLSGKFAGAVVVIDDITRRKVAEQDQERLIEELRKALAEVKQISGLLPICSSCKNIRDDKGYWQKVESYISDRSQAQFSHGLCPDCVEKLYPGLRGSCEK